MCKNTLDKLCHSEPLFSAFRIIFGAFSEKRAIAPSLRALSAETESFQHPGTQTHTAAHFGRGRNKRAALTMRDPVTLILSASPAAPSRSSRRAHRKCPDVQLRRVCVEERVRWVGWGSGGKEGWGGEVNGTISWEVRVSEPRRAPTSRGVTSCLTQPNVERTDPSQ